MKLSKKERLILQILAHQGPATGLEVVDLSKDPQKKEPARKDGFAPINAIAVFLWYLGSQGARISPSAFYTAGQDLEERGLIKKGIRDEQTPVYSATPKAKALLSQPQKKSRLFSLLKNKTKS